MDRATELKLIEAHLRVKPAGVLPTRHAARFSSRVGKPRGEVYIARKPTTFRSKTKRK